MSAEMLTRPELHGSFGMVASTHWLASQTGMSVLERSGNAFDAAAATAFVLEVVEPHLNGIGGDVPIIGWDAGAESAFVLCGQGPAPAAATTDTFRDLGLDAVPGSGLLPACVPGAFGAWIRLVRDRGTWRLRDVLSYAIHYAANGFFCLPRISQAIESVQELFLREWPGSRDLWLVRGEAPEAGTTIANPALARTFERIVREAEAVSDKRERQLDAAFDCFYRGFVAEAIEDFVRSTPTLDSSGRRHAGLLSGEDLAAWSPAYEEPIALDYHGHTVLKCGPWSQGPVFLQQLALLKGWDLAALAPTSAEFVHIVTECAKLAFADREAHYGDPRFSSIGIDAFLTEEYNAARRKLVGHVADNGDLRPGSPDGRIAVLPPLQASAGERGSGLGAPSLGAPSLGEPTLREIDGSGDTCHVDVVDSQGNMVAATPSGGWLQSSPAIPGLGFALGTRAQMFTLTPETHPNALAPGKRPRTTLSPTMTLRGDRPHLAFGTPGGDTQDQCSLIFLLRHLHHGMNLQEAIEAPAFVTEHFPSSFFPRTRDPGRLVLEDRFDHGALARLSDLGHDVVLNGPWSLGRLSAVSRSAGGLLRAAANPRGAQGYAAGR